MIIKPLKTQFVGAIFFLILSVVSVPFIFSLVGLKIWEHKKLLLMLSVIVTVPMIVVSIRNWIANCTTIIMDEKGCTVKRFGIKKRYLWSELQTKCVEDYELRRCAGNPNYYKAVIFSKRKNFHTLKFLHIITYLMYFCLNPFKFFYVGFMYNPNPKNNEVDEKLFMEKMNEWGIELTEYKNGSFRPYKNFAGKLNEAETAQKDKKTNQLDQ